MSTELIIDVLSRNEETDAKRWIFAMHNVLPHAEFTILVVTLWALWSSRRKAIHEHIYQSPFSVHAFIQSYINELKVVQTGTARPPGAPVQRPMGWIAPPAGLTKINVDAAVGRGRRHGAVAAISRDNTGQFLGASVVVYGGISDPATLECMAVREALALAEDLNVTDIKVASDSKVVVTDIREKNPTEYGAIIHEIMERSSSFLFCNFCHEFRARTPRLTSSRGTLYPFRLADMFGWASRMDFRSSM